MERQFTQKEKYTKSILKYMKNIQIHSELQKDNLRQPLFWPIKRAKFQKYTLYAGEWGGYEKTDLWYIASEKANWYNPVDWKFGIV